MKRELVICVKRSLFSSAYENAFSQNVSFCCQAFESAACFVVYIYNAFIKIVNINFSIL